jgi:hypothetical protein
VHGSRDLLAFLHLLEGIEMWKEKLGTLFRHRSRHPCSTEGEALKRVRFWALMFIGAGVCIAGASASVVAKRVAPNAPAGCLAVKCLESEDAYAAYLEPTEPSLQWSRVRSVRFENGQVVLQLHDVTAAQLWAALDRRLGNPSRTR